MEEDLSYIYHLRKVLGYRMGRRHSLRVLVFNTLGQWFSNFTVQKNHTDDPIPEFLIQSDGGGIGILTSSLVLFLREPHFEDYYSRLRLCH